MDIDETYSWEQLARAFWDMLDEIDTASDIAKADSGRYRKLVSDAHMKRWKYSKSDGYTVSFRVHPRGGNKCTCVIASSDNTPAVAHGAEMGGYVKVKCEFCQNR